LRQVLVLVLVLLVTRPLILLVDQILLLLGLLLVVALDMAHTS
jgi:hypothetical protein